MSTIINEVAQRIADDEAELSGREQCEDAIIEVAIPILESFKLAIECSLRGELNGAGEVVLEQARMLSEQIKQCAKIKDRLNEVQRQNEGLRNALAMSSSEREAELERQLNETTKHFNDEREHSEWLQDECNKAVDATEEANRRCNEIDQQNAVLKYDWLAQCGLRYEYELARKVIAEIVAALPQKRDWLNPDIEREAKRIATQKPLPENVKYIGSFAWAYAGMKAGKRARHPDMEPTESYHIGEWRQTGMVFLNDFNMPISITPDEMDRCDWITEPDESKVNNDARGTQQLFDLRHTQR